MCTMQWIIPEKKDKRGDGGEGEWLGTYFFENPLEFLGFLLYPWKFQIKQMSYCLNQLERYGTVRKTNKEQLCRSPYKNWSLFLMKCMILKCILKRITNNCKPPQSSDFFYIYLVWKVSMGLLFSIDEKMETIGCPVFYLVMKMEVLNIFAKSHIRHGRQQ